MISFCREFFSNVEFLKYWYFTIFLKRKERKEIELLSILYASGIVYFLPYPTRFTHPSQESMENYICVFYYSVIGMSLYKHVFPCGIP